jgi:Bacteriocin-protection, YdeI or OmpD-Associated
VERYANSFAAVVDKYDFGKYFYTVVYFPRAITDELPLDQYPRLRLEAEIDGLSVDGALMLDRVGSAQTRHLLEAGLPAGQKIWYYIVSKKVLQKIGKALGDEVTVGFRIAQQDAVDVPRALTELLEQNETLREKWQTLTAGKQRGLVHGLNTAKTGATRAKRLEQIEIALLEL